MQLDFMDRIHVSPSKWGVAKMMERISYIQDNFGVEKWMPSKKGFQQALDSEMTAPVKNDIGVVEKKNETLFAPGTLPGPSKIEGKKLDDILNGASEKYGLDRKMLEAVIKTESNFNPRAVSKKGAMGLMQLMPNTAWDMNVKNPFDPAQNVDGGAKYLKSMMDKFGDPQLALSAYNAGPKAVETYKGIPPYQETQDYVKKVMQLLKDG